MTRVDQFESVFRSAAKEVFVYERVALRKVVVAPDLEGEAATEFRERLKRFLAVLGDGPEWFVAAPDTFGSVRELLEIVEEQAPDLVCSYRNLTSGAWRWPYSLGEYLDVLTQVASCPVLVMPHPLAGRAYEHAVRDTDRVMAITDHLAGDSRLVNWAVHFTQPGGRLLLAHVEDEQTFDRYLDVISKIPAIDTDTAREELRAQLLKEPADYVRSCAAALAEAGVDVHAESVVAMGRHLDEYRRVIEEHEVDLLVLNTKDHDQLAMHGLAYPLTVELREVPLLML